MKITILGSGGSGGVPLIGNRWGNCNPDNSKNRRTRPSILVEQGTTTILVDTSPDMRHQLLEIHTHRLDAVLYSHAHADHCHGIDDLREMCRLIGHPLPCYADAHALEKLKERFAYCFQPLPPNAPIIRPVLTPHVVTGPFQVGTIDIIPFVQDHGFSVSMGYRFDLAAYSIDVKRFDESALEVLRGIEVWILDCVRIAPEHQVHLVFHECLSYIEHVQPRRAILTHLSAEIDYDDLVRRLPVGVEAAYDGMVIEL